MVGLVHSGSSDFLSLIDDQRVLLSQLLGVVIVQSGSISPYKLMSEFLLEGSESSALGYGDILEKGFGLFTDNENEVTTHDYTEYNLKQTLEEQNIIPLILLQQVIKSGIFH